MLDITPNGTIDNGPGKNSGMRRYREATDLNKPGDVFSAKLMEGKVIKVRIGHEEYQGELLDRVTGVSKA